MNALLKHIWGESPGADRVWAQVTGMRPTEAVRAILAVIQAFMDESEGEDGTLVIAGYIARAETWAEFAPKWEKMLPYATRARDREWHFKMSELADAGRIDRTRAFHRIIEEHPIAAISCAVNRRDLACARERVWVPNYRIDWDYANNLYRFAFRGLFDTLQRRRDEIDAFLAADRPLDFIFDERVEKKPILEEWDGFVEAYPPAIRAKFGATPRFENDRKFLPLQAADLWAWWARKWVTENTPDKIIWADFGDWRGRPELGRLHISYDEETIVQVLAEQCSSHVAPYLIYDRKNPYPKWWRSLPVTYSPWGGGR